MSATLEERFSALRSASLEGGQEKRSASLEERPLALRSASLEGRDSVKKERCAGGAAFGLEERFA